MIGGYVAVLGATCFVLESARRRTIADLGNAVAGAEWDAWREETIRQSGGTGPVFRRPAKATEPPMLILMRDYYPSVAITSTVAATVFYWFLAIAVRGSISRTGGTVHSRASSEEVRRR